MTAMEVRCSDLLEENPLWGAQLTDSPSCCLFRSITTFLPRLFLVNDWGIVLVLAHFCLMQDSSSVQVLFRDSPMVWPKFLQNCVAESLSAQSIVSLPSQVSKLHHCLKTLSVYAGSLSLDEDRHCPNKSLVCWIQSWHLLLRGSELMPVHLYIYYTNIIT